MTVFRKSLAVFLLAIGSLSAADRPKPHHHRGLVRVVAHAVRWVLITLCLLLVPIARAQDCSSCGGPFDHQELAGEWCQDARCEDPQVWDHMQAWHCWNDGGSSTLCYFDLGCDYQCATQLSNKDRRQHPGDRTPPSWKFDPSKLIGLWERYQFKWVSYHGACKATKQVRAVNLTHSISIQLKKT